MPAMPAMPTPTSMPAISDFILQIVIFIPILYYTRNYRSLFLLSISVDSIISAINFFKIFILYAKSDEIRTIIDKSNKLYRINIINRYIYYTILEISYYITTTLLWNHYNTIIYYILISSICPEILNSICNQYFKTLFKIINTEKQKFIKTIICRQLAILINMISTLCIDINPEISYTELLFLFDDYDKTFTNILTFFKNLLIISAIHYTRKNSNIFYGTLITYFYSYKTGNMIESMNIDIARDKFRTVIVYRRWNQLFDPAVMRSIIYIYSIQDEGNMDTVYKIIFDGNYRLLKMFCTWSISAFFEMPIIASSISIFFLIYTSVGSMSMSKKHLLFKLAIFISIAISNIQAYFLTSFISEFGFIILHNKILFSIAKYIWEKCIELATICSHYNDYNVFIIAIAVIMEGGKMAYMWEYLDFKTLATMMIIIISLIGIQQKYKQMVVIYFIVFGFLSKYNEIHLAFMAILLYIIINVGHFQAIGINKNAILRKNILKSIMESYYQNGISASPTTSVIIRPKEQIDLASINEINIGESYNPPTIYETNNQAKILDRNAHVIENYNDEAFSQKT